MLDEEINTTPASSKNRFWQWYERHYAVHVGIGAGLFILQLVHLFWLATNVVLPRLFGGDTYWQVTPFWQDVIIFVDYTEIPALFSASLLYIHSLTKRFNSKDLLYLLLVNSQWLHLFWITDEFVVEQFTGAAHSTLLPVWLAWIAIIIDYLELPVIYDTIKRFIKIQVKKVV